MTYRGIDYSWSKPSVGSVVSAGYQFVGRYVGTSGDGKCITASEYLELTGAGLTVILFFESTPDRALGGALAGAWDAKSVREFLSEERIPPDTPVFYTVDTAVSPDQMFLINAYFASVSAVAPAGTVGVYGDYDVIEATLSGDFASLGFQTAAWSEGRIHPRAIGYQSGEQAVIDGVTVDVDTLTTLIFEPAAEMEDIVLSNIPAPAGTDAHVAFGCAGAGKLRLHLAYGESVTVFQIVPEGDTPPGDGGGQLPGGFDAGPGDEHPWVWKADRDGPWDIPPGATQLVVRYSSAVPFVVSVSDR